MTKPLLHLKSTMLMTEHVLSCAFMRSSTCRRKMMMLCGCTERTSNRDIFPLHLSAAKDLQKLCVDWTLGCVKERL